MFITSESFGSRESRKLASIIRKATSCPNRNVQSLVGQALNAGMGLLMKINLCLVSLTKVSKKTKEQKNALINEVGSGLNVETFPLLTNQLGSSKKILTSGNIVGCLRSVRCAMLISKLSGGYGKSASFFAYRRWSLSFNMNLISTARIFLGRGAVMAKALGSTIEEEHREGLHNLSKVASVHQFYSCGLTCVVIANKRPSRIILYRHRATGGYRVV
jgi:hypothetical protein